MSLLDVASYFSHTEQAVPGSDEEIAVVLAHDKLISKDVGGRWNILNLGAILFAKDVGQFDSIARKAVRVIKYDGLSRTEQAKEQVGVRGYAVGFDALIGFVAKWLPTEEVMTRSLRVRKNIYPEVAVRELVANALLHQDMTLSGASPVIEIFADRVEITNPGQPLLDTNRFIDLPPRSRNEALASLMRKSACARSAVAASTRSSMRLRRRSYRRRISAPTMPARRSSFLGARRSASSRGKSVCAAVTSMPCFAM